METFFVNLLETVTQFWLKLYKTTNVIMKKIFHILTRRMHYLVTRLLARGTTTPICFKSKITPSKKTLKCYGTVRVQREVNRSFSRLLKVWRFCEEKKSRPRCTDTKERTNRKFLFLSKLTVKRCELIQFLVSPTEVASGGIV